MSDELIDRVLRKLMQMADKVATDPEWTNEDVRKGVKLGINLATNAVMREAGKERS